MNPLLFVLAMWLLGVVTGALVTAYLLVMRTLLLRTDQNTDRGPRP